jgi:hypothetical protein
MYVPREVPAPMPQTLPVEPDDAVRMANEYFGRAADASCYFEDRGSHYYISPPFIRKADIERNAIYINKQNGKIRKNEIE